MVIRLPHNLREKTVAFASQVMANFNAILNGLKDIIFGGVSYDDVQQALTAVEEKITQKVDKHNVGNTNEIIFTDGDSLQYKLDSGDLKGADGAFVYGVGGIAFGIDFATGHLKMTTSNEDEYAYVNDRGHVIVQVPDPVSQGDFYVHDLGRVVGQRGEPGEVTLVQMQDYVNSQIIKVTRSASLVCSVLAANWDATEKTCVVDCEGVTADVVSNNFMVSVASVATDEQRQAFRNALMYVVEQQEGSFVVKAEMTVPGVDIPLDVTVNI